jgi:hypothetical protein
MDTAIEKSPDRGSKVILAEQVKNKLHNKLGV